MPDPGQKRTMQPAAQLCATDLMVYPRRHRLGFP